MRPDAHISVSRTPQATTPFAHTHYGTIVVGAGPAGVMAAIHAAERAPVLLLDRHDLPRRKSCGGMLHALALQALQPYGTVPEAIVQEPRSVSFRYLDWDRGVCKATDVAFLNVSRSGFDQWLLGLLPATVEVKPAATLVSLTQAADTVTAVVKVSGGEYEVTADLLIGADGARSQTRRSLAHHAAASYVTAQDFVELRGPMPPHFDCIYMRRIGGDLAFVYIVPKDDVALVGSVFYPHTRSPAEKQDEILASLREQLPQLGASAGREAAAAAYLRSTEDILPGRGRVLLAGEAGGFLSPTSGEGISWALRSGRLAGIAATGSPEDALDRYLSLTAELRGDVARRIRWLPFMESRAGKYLSAYVPQRLVSRVTQHL